MNVSYQEAIRRGWLRPEEAPKAARSTHGRPADIEGEEQRTLIQLFRLRFPAEGLLLIHIPNGGSRKNAYEGWRLKAQGVRAGVSDLFLPVARGGFFGLWIEFKAAPPNNAALSISQQEWLALMRDQGYRAEACCGIDDARAVLENYMALPATVALCPGAPATAGAR